MYKYIHSAPMRCTLHKNYIKIYTAYIKFKLPIEL